MNIILNILIVIVLSSAIYLFTSLTNTKSLLNKYEREIASLKKQLSIDDPEPSVSKKPEIRIMVEVLNPLKLARSRSDLAKLTVSAAPVSVEKIVYKQVMKEMKKEFLQKNVDTNLQMQVI